ncbi:MAG TPA: sialidase family protein [bacterium]|nr:sialidase family protein [bacterium]
MENSFEDIMKFYREEEEKQKKIKHKKIMLKIKKSKKIINIILFWIIVLSLFFIVKNSKATIDVNNFQLDETGLSDQENWATFVSGGDYSFACIFKGSCYISSDNGKNWSNATSPDPTHKGWRQAGISETGQYMLVVANNGTNMGSIQHSSNYGANWTTEAEKNDFSAGNMNATGQYMLACKWISNYCRYSSNYGASWSTLTPGTYGWTSINFSDNGQYVIMTSRPYIGSSGGIHVSSDYGASFTNSYNGTNITNNTFGSSAISPSGQYILAYNYEANLLYYSLDYGSNWSTISLDLSEYSRNMYITDNGEIVIANLQNILYFADITTSESYTTTENLNFSTLENRIEKTRGKEELNLITYSTGGGLGLNDTYYIELKESIKGSIYWQGIGTQYCAINTYCSIPVYYNFCENWEKIDTFSLDVATTDNFPNTEFSATIKTTETNAPCSGSKELIGYVSGKEIFNATTTIDAIANGNIVKQKEFFYTASLKAPYDVPATNTQTNNGSWIYAMVPAETRITQGLSTGTSTISFAYVINDETLATSTHKFYIYDNELGQITDYYTEFDELKGQGEIIITNQNYGKVMNYSIILSNNTYPNEILLQSNFFIIRYGAFNYENVVGINDSFTTILGTTTIEGIDGIIGDKATGIMQKTINKLVMILGNVFPTNIIVKFHQTWLNSATRDLPSDLNLFNYAGTNGDIYVYVPKEWGGGESEQKIVWGKTLFYDGGTAETTFKNIKSISTYFLWFMFVWTIYNNSKKLYQDLIEK